jgi:hypothetical protein
VVVDSISNKYEEDGPISPLSFIVTDWIKDVHQEWLQDPKISKMIQTLQQASLGYLWHHDELHYKGHMYLRKQLKLKAIGLSKFHASPIAGHSCFTKTYERVKRSLFWDGMK